MIQLISTIMTESDREFENRFRNSSLEAQQEMLEIRNGIKKRNAFMATQDMNLLFFKSAAEKLEKIREWYPRCYEVLASNLPGFVNEPDDMPQSIKHLADSFIWANLLPSDRGLLAFS